MLFPLFLVSSNDLILNQESKDFLFNSPQGLMDFFQWGLATLSGNPLYTCLWAVFGLGLLFCIVRRVIDIVT